MRERFLNGKKLTRHIAGIVVISMVLLGLSPVGTVFAAGKAYLYVKGSKVQYDITKTKAIFVGGVSVNFDYNIKGKVSGMSGKWTSSDTSIVKVNKYGVCKAYDNGEVVITYTYKLNGKTYSLKTNMKAYTRASEVAIVTADGEEFSGTIEVGDSVDFDRVLTPNPKAVKVNPDIVSTYKSYPELFTSSTCKTLADESIATIDNMGVVTAVSPGSVFLRVTSKHSKNATYGVVYSDVVKITVVPAGESEDKPEEKTENSAKQTDVDTITVTSTTDIEKVIIKQGNTTLVQAEDSPVIAEDKRSAKIVMPTRLSATKYNVYVNDSEEPMEVECTTQKLDKIELDSEYAVLDKLATIGTNYPKAYVYYRLYDQFGNDVTKNPSFPYTDFNFGGIFRASAAGVLEATFPNPQIDMEYEVLIIHPTSMTQLKQTVKLAKPAYPEKIEIVGIYEYVNATKGYVKRADLNESNITADDDPIIDFGSNVASNKTIGAYYLLLKVENQYGGTITEAGVDNMKMIINLTGVLCGLNLDTVYVNGTEKYQSINPVTIGSESYLTFPLKAGELKEGIAMLSVFAVGSGQQVTGSINVLPAYSIKEFKMTQVETLYETKESYLDFSVTDNNGEVVTEYSKLIKLTRSTDTSGVAKIADKDILVSSFNSEFYWEKQQDGTARLKYIPSDSIISTSGSGNTQIFGVDTVQILPQTKNMQLVVFNVYEKPIPTTIVGLKSDATTGALLGGNAVVIRQKDIIVNDQYGLQMSDKQVKESGIYFELSGYNELSGNGKAFDTTSWTVGSNTMVSSSAIGAAAVVKVSSDPDNEIAGTGIYAPILSLKTQPASGGAAGSAYFDLYLNNGGTPATSENATGTRLNNSKFQVVINAVDLNQISTTSLSVKDIKLLSNSDTNFHGFEVMGVAADGSKVRIPSNNYFVYGTDYDSQQFLVGNEIQPNRIKLEEISSNLTSGTTLTRTFNYVIIINNREATELKASCTISNEPRRVGSFTLRSEELALTDITAANGLGNALKTLIIAKDQYGDDYNLGTTNTDVIRFVVSGLPSNYTINKNGTGDVTVSSLKAGDMITVRFIVNDAVPYTTTIRIK